MPVEMAEPFAEYEGWISSSWLQEETLFVDVLPRRIELPRRYSFRYLKIEVLATSAKYRVAFEDIICTTVTSADASAVQPLGHSDETLKEIDRVSIRTLEDCMQDVFEDGPKRDRRLWLGDLRLEALANYETFRNMELVKRCLYLFAGVPDEQGRVSANLFIEPAIIADDTYLFDYSLFFTTTLFDYYMASGDEDTLKELWPTARKQVELALEQLDDQGLVQDQETWWSFIDWHPQLNKQASSHAILIYTLKKPFSWLNRLAVTAALLFPQSLPRPLKQLWTLYGMRTQAFCQRCGPADFLGKPDLVCISRSAAGRAEQAAYAAPAQLPAGHRLNHAVYAPSSGGGAAGNRMQGGSGGSFKILLGRDAGRRGRYLLGALRSCRQKLFSLRKLSNQQLLSCLELHTGLSDPSLRAVTYVNRNPDHKLIRIFFGEIVVQIHLVRSAAYNQAANLDELF